MASAKQIVIITGIKAIDKKLKLLAPKVQKKVVRQAMRKGLKIVQAEVKAQVPVDTGTAKKAVKVRATRRRKRGTIELEVVIKAVQGETIKTGSGGERWFYPAIVEYGHAKTAPNPFMRRAYEASGEPARQVTMRSLLEGVEREARAR